MPPGTDRPTIPPPATPSGRRLRSAAALGLGGLASGLSRALGRGNGNQIRGRVALAVDPELPRTLARGRTVVLVSATNGKTATASMLAATLRDTGRSVTTNADGANLLAGMTSALAADPAAPVAVLECDEANLPFALELMSPALVVLGNLSRDQLDRHLEVRRLAERWKDVLARFPTRVIASNSDPNVAWAVEDVEDVTWVDTGLVSRLDNAICPRCRELLDLSADTWSCKCGFARPDATVSLDGEELRLGDRRLPLELRLTWSWQRANAALALAAADALGLDAAGAAASVGRLESVGNRRSRVELGDGRSAELVLAKNPSSWALLIDELEGSSHALVIAQDDNAADGTDPSWLWDVPFERLGGLTIATAGSRALDVAVRLAHAGCRPMAIEDDPLEAARALPGDDLVVAASYTIFHGMALR
ncbi:MAG: MurT ligase domain-containing protein [Microthrixaceae bacterium]